MLSWSIKYGRNDDTWFLRQKHISYRFFLSLSSLGSCARTSLSQGIGSLFILYPSMLEKSWGLYHMEMGRGTKELHLFQHCESSGPSHQLHWWSLQDDRYNQDVSPLHSRLREMRTILTDVCCLKSLSFGVIYYAIIGSQNKFLKYSCIYLQFPFMCMFVCLFVFIEV